MRELVIFVGIISIVVSLAYVSSVNSAWESDDLQQMEAKFNAIECRAATDIQRSQELLNERMKRKESR